MLQFSGMFRQADLRIRICALATILWGMIRLTTMWMIAIFAANLLQCLPISADWSSIVDNSQGTCIKTDVMFLAQAWSDVLIDVVILSMPMTCVRELSFAPNKGWIRSDLGTSDCSNAGVFPCPYISARNIVSLPIDSSTLYWRESVLFARRLQKLSMMQKTTKLRLPSCWTV